MRLVERTTGAVGFLDRRIAIFYGAMTRGRPLAHYGVSIGRVFIGVVVRSG